MNQMRRMLPVITGCVLVLLGYALASAGSNTDKPAGGYQYDVNGRIYSGNKTIVIWVDHLGDKPTVTYYLDPTKPTENYPLRAYTFVGPWVVDVNWHPSALTPQVVITPRSQ